MKHNLGIIYAKSLDTLFEIALAPRLISNINQALFYTHLTEMGVREIAHTNSGKFNLLELSTLLFTKITKTL